MNTLLVPAAAKVAIFALESNISTIKKKIFTSELSVVLSKVTESLLYILCYFIELNKH